MMTSPNPLNRHWSRLDHANGILYGVSQFNINKLQMVQNTLARVVLRAYNLTDATPLLAKLHWSPIERRLLFKLVTLTFKSSDCGQPSYLSVLPERFIPARALRSSSDATRLAVPRSKTKNGSCAIRIASATILEQCIGLHKNSAKSVQFSSTSKNILFQSVFIIEWFSPHAPPIHCLFMVIFVRNIDL